MEVLKNQPTNNRVHRGQAIVYTEEELDEQTLLSETDIENARASWVKHAPAWAKDVPDASVDEKP